MSRSLLVLLSLIRTAVVTSLPPSHASDDCIDGPRNTSTHHRVPGYKIFCMGSKDNNITYMMKTGCLKDASCDYFMSAKIVINPNLPDKRPHMQWNLFAKQGDIIFFLSRNLINTDSNLSNIDFVTVLNTTEYRTVNFTSYHYPGGRRDGFWGNKQKFNSFQEDPGGDVPYEGQRALEVGPKGNPKETYRINYNRVSVTTWNEGNDTDDTWVPNAKIYPLIPYLIGIKRTSDPPEVTVISSKQFLHLFSDDVTKMAVLNKAAEHFYLGGGEVTTTTTSFFGEITSKTYIWFTLGVLLAFVLLSIIICCCCHHCC